METYTPFERMQAHQYLYYVLARPVLSDYAYDMFCQAHLLEGHGGSDLAESYSARVIELAESLL